MPGPVSNWLKVRFITGFFVTVPAVATSWLLYVFWDNIDGFFSPMYERIFGRRIPGLGFLTAMVVIFVMGTIATNVVGRRILSRVERLFEHLPVFRSIYPSIKQLFESFSPQKRTSFKEVVLAEHPRKGEFVFGFVTSELLLDGPDGQARHGHGIRAHQQPLPRRRDRAAPREDAVTTGLTVEEGIRVILSAGTATPRRLPRRRA